MPGELDPAYVKARHVLLDALEALEPQLGSIILVGAQAVYFHAGEADMAVAPYTTDADLAVDTDSLSDAPELEAAMTAAGFVAGDQPGAWLGRDRVAVDLMVAEVQGGGGSRAARIPPHGRRAARKALGLEGALVDNETLTIGALDSSDDRSFPLLIAGPAALLIAKAIKIEERRGNPKRVSDKDALDVLRLLRASATEDVVARMVRIHADKRSAAVATRTMDLLPDLFGSTSGHGCEMIVRATEGLDDSDQLVASSIALVEDLLSEWNRR